MNRRLCAIALAVLTGTCGSSSIARAEGDPGSDVLVSQNLFVASDAGLSVREQVALGNLLQAASRSGFPVRVAIIASRDDLGAVTALWRKPQAYAGFLGEELSLAYKQRLLVVMPNGFGFYWSGHSTSAASRLLAEIPTRPGTSGLRIATQAAVNRLAAASANPGNAGTGAASPGAGAPGAGEAHSNRGVDVIASALVAALIAVGLLTTVTSAGDGAILGRPGRRGRRGRPIRAGGLCSAAGSGSFRPLVSCLSSPARRFSPRALTGPPLTSPGALTWPAILPGSGHAAVGRRARCHAQ